MQAGQARLRPGMRPQRGKAGASGRRHHRSAAARAPHLWERAGQRMHALRAVAGPAALAAAGRLAAHGPLVLRLRPRLPALLLRLLRLPLLRVQVAAGQLGQLLLHCPQPLALRPLRQRSRRGRRTLRGRQAQRAAAQHKSMPRIPAGRPPGPRLPRRRKRGPTRPPMPTQASCLLHLPTHSRFFVAPPHPFPLVCLFALAWFTSSCSISWCSRRSWCTSPRTCRRGAAGGACGHGQEGTGRGAGRGEPAAASGASRGACAWHKLP